MCICMPVCVCACVWICVLGGQKEALERKRKHRRLGAEKSVHMFRDFELRTRLSGFTYGQYLLQPTPSLLQLRKNCPSPSDSLGSCLFSSSTFAAPPYSTCSKGGTKVIPAFLIPAEQLLMFDWLFAAAWVFPTTP